MVKSVFAATPRTPTLELNALPRSPAGLREKRGREKEERVGNKGKGEERKCTKRIGRGVKDGKERKGCAPP